MSILVSKQSGNIGDANIWYRAEAYNFSDTSSTSPILSIRRFIDTTYANAGNALGIVLSFTTASGNLLGYTKWGGVLAELQENLGTCTTPVASPGIVTKTGHGFTGAKAATITTGTPGIITFAGHGLTLDRPVGFTTTGAFTGITAGTKYYVIPIDTDNFNIAAYPGGPALDISAASGTISMWDEWCDFSTTGALPTGITTTGGLYCVKYINANTFNISLTAGGSNINFTGSTSGTHSLWVPRRMKGLTAANITNSSTYVRGSWCRGFDIDAYAVDTTASKWRWCASHYVIGSSTQYWNIRTSNGSAPFYVVWCDTTQTYSDTNDAIVIRSDSSHVITINQSIQPKPYIGTGATNHGYHAIICSSLDPSPANVAAFVWENPASASYTYTMDGVCKISSDAGFRCGTLANPISATNQAIFICKRTPSVGIAGMSGFGDGSGIISGNYYFDKTGLFLYGEVPTVKQCRLVSNAAISQKDLVCDDVTGFNVGDTIFVGRENAASYASTSNQSNNTIASIAGNTITMTSNLTGNLRYGRVSVGTCTISIATPGVVTLASHGLFDNEEVVFTTTGSLPTGITADTGYYYVKVIDANTFYLRPSRGSTSYINTSGSDSGTHTCLRAGGHVTRMNGYGIFAKSDTVTSTSHAYWAFHAPMNMQFKGVLFQNIYNYWFVAGAYSVPYSDLSVQEQWLTKDCFFLSYEKLTACGVAGACPHPTLGWLFQNNIVIGPTINYTTAFISNSLVLDVGSRTIKSGPFYVLDNYFAKSVLAIYPTNANGGWGVVENNYFDNNNLGAVVVGNSKTTIRYNYSWGATAGTYIYGGTGIKKSLHTQNVYDKCQYAIYLQSIGTNDCGEYKNVYNPTTAGVSDFYSNGGGYVLGDAGYVIDSPSRTLSTFETNFLNYLSDYVSVSKIRVANNGGTANDNWVLSSEGFWRSTGDGLADTTVHTSGTGKYAFRLDPFPTASLRAEKIASLPIGDCTGKTLTAGVWVNIYSANFYAGTYELPRLTIDYDNGTTVYAQALAQTGWQYISVSFTPTTNFARVLCTLSANTDATFASTTTPGDTTVYFDDFSLPPPADRPPVNLGAYDLWANGEPIEPWMGTPIFAPGDVWAADPTTFGTGTVGELQTITKDNSDAILGILVTK